MKHPFLHSYLSRFPQRALTCRPERKLLSENIDLKVEYYIGAIDDEWPLPNKYWFGDCRDISDDIAEIEYEWQMMKGKYGL